MIAFSANFLSGNIIFQKLTSWSLYQNVMNDILEEKMMVSCILLTRERKKIVLYTASEVTSKGHHCIIVVLWLKQSTKIPYNK